MRDPTEVATEQLRGILSEIGGIDYEWLVEELKEIDYLENPAASYRQGVEEAYEGKWDDFVFIWRSYHLYRIAKRLWRKFERIAKKYPNFDRLIEDIVKNNKK